MLQCSIAEHVLSNPRTDDEVRYMAAEFAGRPETALRPRAVLEELMTWQSIGWREVDAVEPPTLVQLMGLTQVYRSECRRRGKAQVGQNITVFR